MLGIFKKSGIYFDDTPTEKSSNVVTSDGIKKALSEAGGGYLVNGATYSRRLSLGANNSFDYIAESDCLVCVTLIAPESNFECDITDYKVSSVSVDGTYRQWLEAMFSISSAKAGNTSDDIMGASNLVPLKRGTRLTINFNVRFDETKSAINLIVYRG